MPGFLGTERQFAARYGKPILASRDAKSSSREQEAGKTLHKSVFLMVCYAPSLDSILGLLFYSLGCVWVMVGIFGSF